MELGAFFWGQVKLENWKNAVQKRTGKMYVWTCLAAYLGVTKFITNNSMSLVTLMRPLKSDLEVQRTGLWSVYWTSKSDLSVTWATFKAVAKFYVLFNHQPSKLNSQIAHVKWPDIFKEAFWLALSAAKMPQTVVKAALVLIHWVIQCPRSQGKCTFELLSPSFLKCANVTQPQRS